MFAFGENEYKWCSECAGNIRNNAAYCRFCRKPLSSKLLQGRPIPVNNTIDSVSQWLPNFNSLLEKLPDEFRSRFEKADTMTPPPHIGIPPGVDPAQYRLDYRESGLCPHEHPEPQVEGLLYDILLSLRESGQSLAEICFYPQLRLIEVTPQEVAAEYELRKTESEKNYPCPYCAEYILPNSEACRFCLGSADEKPKVVEWVFDKEVDPKLLKEVLVYESVMRRRSNAPQISEDILLASGVNVGVVDEALLLMTIDGDDKFLPMPRFYKRMVELKLSMPPGFSVEERAISALIELGSALDKKNVNRTEEALIVYRHALARTEGKDELMDERSRVATYISLLFQKQEDFENYDVFHAMSKDCRAAAAPPGLEALMSASDDDLMDFANLMQDDGDPEKQLAYFDKMVEDSEKMFGISTAALDEAIPGISEMFAGLKSSLDKTMQSGRLSMEAHVARQRGDLEQAESKYLQALSMHSDDSRESYFTSPHLLCELGEICHMQGRNSEAQSHFDKAIAMATEYCEVAPDMGKSTLWPCHMRLGCFQRDTGALELSKQSFETALFMQLQAAEDGKRKYGGGEYDGFTSQVKAEYAKLMRISGRADEAERLERESAELKAASDAATAEAKAKQKRFKDHKRKEVP